MLKGFDLAGRVAIVTGSGQRLGREIALALVACGASVVITARTNEDGVKNVVDEINASGGKAAGCLADVTKPDDVNRLINTAIEVFGRLDILVNNAAVRPADPFRQMTLAKWQSVTQIILDGAFLCSLAATPHLEKSGHGRIINIGGLTGHIGALDRVHVVTAKAGLIGLTKALALELGPSKVTVNCVVPGLIETPNDDAKRLAIMRKRTPPETIPMQRTGTPPDVANAVALLCGDGMEYITGQALHINGGLYLC